MVQIFGVPTIFETHGRFEDESLIVRLETNGPLATFEPWSLGIEIDSPNSSVQIVTAFNQNGHSTWTTLHDSTGQKIMSFEDVDGVIESGNNHLTYTLKPAQFPIPSGGLRVRTWWQGAFEKAFTPWNPVS